MIEFFDEATHSVVQWQARTLFENRKHSKTKHLKLMHMGSILQTIGVKIREVGGEKKKTGLLNLLQKIIMRKITNLSSTNFVMRKQMKYQL
ncbi:hypothetical protein [Candidatus Mesenet endosymbiont of Agriotes lineatus]|uniref:hypothetical protein n=1 Tax=Candidatus Mesenet endosymbiont of Agriotes lineatus TaxID=3077948 RepID=UPI0030CBF81D